MKLLSLLLVVGTLVASQANAARFPKNLPNFLSKNSSSGSTEMLYYGGPVISNPQIYVVFWGPSVSATTKAAMPDFYASMVNSDYMDFLKIYNTSNVTVQGTGHTGTNQSLGRGTFLQAIQINPAKLSGTIDDSEIRVEIQKQIDAHVLPAPTASSLYMFHFPKGLKITMTDGATVATSCQQFCAYHEGFQPSTGAPVYYGVMPDLDSLACSFGCGSGGSLARVTVSASHELIEAITDPFPTPGSHPGFPQAWNTADGQEVGDLCQSNTGSLKGHAANYTIQQEWSSALGGCTTGNYIAQ
jgi:hypothetical protein